LIRWDSAEELANDLRPLQRGEPVQARPAAWVERSIKGEKRRPAVASLMALVFLVTVVAFALEWKENGKSITITFIKDRGAEYIFKKGL
jgi:hypothetical protein